MTFNDWWETVGQRIQQSQYSSRDDFIKCVARITWEDATVNSLEERPDTIEEAFNKWSDCRGVWPMLNQMEIFTAGWIASIGSRVNAMESSLEEMISFEALTLNKENKHD